MRNSSGDEAPPWFERLVEAGDVRALVCVADEMGGDAEELYRHAAEAGEYVAMERLANIHHDDKTAVLSWRRQAAEAGSTYSMVQLSYETDDDAEAERWLRLASDLGSGWGRSRLCDLLSGQERFAEAEQQYRLAIASSGEGWGLLHSGLAKVLVRMRRTAEAEELYRSGAALGDLLAMEDLADLLSARGAEDEALRWRERHDELLSAEKNKVGPGTAGASLGALIATSVVTAAVMPFVQTLATKAAEETYEAARRLLERAFARNRHTEEDGYCTNRLLVVKDPDPQLNLALHLWTDTSDGALQELQRLDPAELEPLRGQGVRRVFWNQYTRAWEVLHDKEHGRD
ncbi:hypothetical protein ACWGJ2_36710 [Streptomyces sp. NPDC054796]